MLNLIEKLDTLLKQYRPAYYEKLLPGLAISEITAFEEVLGFSLPQDYKDLYQWRNGQSTSYYEAFHWNQTWMSNKEVKGSISDLNALLRGGDFEKTNWWNSMWIPFLSNGAGDHFCLDIAGVFTGQKEQIIEFRHNHAERKIVAPNMAIWLADYVALLEQEDWDYYRETGKVPFLEWKCNTPGYPIRQMAG